MRRLFLNVEDEPFTHYWDVSVSSHSYDEKEDLIVLDLNLAISCIEYDMGVDNSIPVMAAFMLNACNYEFLDRLIDWPRVNREEGYEVDDRDDSRVRINIQVESDCGIHLGNISLLYERWRLKSMLYTSSTTE